MWSFIVAAAFVQVADADCSDCCVPPQSPAASASKAITCSGCDSVAMQVGCMLDKVGALCGIAEYLEGCSKKSTAAEKVKCAGKSKIHGLPRVIMGEGPDAGDKGILDDYKLCCSRGSTMFHPEFNNATCSAMAESWDKVWNFHEKYWGCASPGTKTTPVGNWTPACDTLGDDLKALTAYTLTTHDTFLESCADGLALADAKDAKCQGRKLTPKPVQQMWDDWTNIAFADSKMTGRKATKACMEQKWKPGCGSTVAVVI
jgi:hypothetical protein